MNRTKNTLGWCDWSWNPITGCRGGCWYCYARAMYRRFGWSFEPQFHPERLIEPMHLRKPSRIFACSVSDFYGPWNPSGSQYEVQEMMRECPQHTFLILTKQYEQLYPLSDNVWIGVTITNRLLAQEAINYLKSRTGQCLKYVSFEPLLDRITCDLSGIDWIIIGRLSGPKRNSEPFNPEWVQSLLDQARTRNIPCFIKNNVGWPERLQQFPQEATSRG
jgi:protein gp37